MKHSERDSEGYLMINHRDSPGVSDEFLGQAAAAFPGMDALPPGSGRGLFEAPVISCVHCQAILIVNPLRNRERGSCPRCRAYICDKCDLLRKIGVPCKPFAQVVDEIQEAAVKEGEWESTKLAVQWETDRKNLLEE